MTAVAAAFPRMTAPLTRAYWAAVGTGTVGKYNRSPLTAAHIIDYTTAGVLEPAEGRTPLFRETCRGWLVEAGAHWRLVVHPRASNDATTAPSFEMPSQRTVALSLENARWAVTLDARAFYWQLPLPAFLRGAFTIVTADGVRLAMTRFPMGARASAAVAEATTRWVIGMPEDETWRGARRRVSYIDNALLIDTDPAEVWKRTNDVGLELSQFAVHRPGETATFIGLEFRIGSPTITRPSSRLVGKWRDAVARARGGRDEYAARELAGLTVAVVERAALPLAVAGELTRPRTGALSRAEEADATAVEARLAGGGWSRVVQPPAHAG